MNPTAAIRQLRELVGDQAVSTGASDLEIHSHDESTHGPVLPGAIVYPKTTAEVSGILAIANREGMPVTGYGAGTSLEGNAVPAAGGIVVDFRDMNRILAIHEEDFQATVQAGVLRLDLEEHLSRYGLFFPPDPGANASIGGMIANNAAGIRAIKYGATRDNVLALTAVLADGRVIKTGSRSVKQSAGYDLRHLIIGSEGTLALVTEATLKLAPVPEHFATAVVAFPDVSSVAAAVHSIMGYGLEPAALEMLHAYDIRWMNEDEDAGLVEAPSLMMEFTGASVVAVDEAMAEARSLSNAAGAVGAQEGLDHQTRAQLWRLRHSARERYARRNPGKKHITIDVSVPVSTLPELVAFAEKACADLGFDLPIYGHAGDGNIHIGVVYAQAAATAATELSGKLVKKALELGGTSTGEHGTGIGKRKYLVDEFGADAVDVMHSIKQALDPNNILNPGKVLPD
jgi:D-lactate dehydrogenase (cytochrome)